MTTGWTCGPGRPPHKSGGRGGEGRGVEAKTGDGSLNCNWPQGPKMLRRKKKTEGFLFTFTFRDLFLPLVFCPDALFMNSWPNFARCTFNDRGKRVESEVNEAKVKLK